MRTDAPPSAFVTAPEAMDEVEQARLHRSLRARLFGDGEPLVLGGRYVLGERIGAGGMGVVHRARDRELDRDVAIKLVRQHDGADEATRAARTRFMAEAKSLARLAHPNVVAIYDIGTVDRDAPGIFIAMELCPGESLRAWLAGVTRPWRAVLDVLLAVGRGLAAAHAVDVIHRDVKPDNVLVGADGRVRLLDFGLSKIGVVDVPSSVGSSDELGGDASIAQTIGVAGTPAYMAPEQYGGKTPIDARADQYAFCVTCWEALFGARPFVAATITGLLEAKLAAAIVVPSGKRIAPALERALRRGLHPDPERRWPTMADLLAALERGRWASERRIALASVATLALVGAGAIGQRQYTRAQRIAACESAGAAIAEVWNDDARERVRTGVLATGTGNAATTFAKATPWIDRQADAWRTHRSEACLDADVHERLDADTYARTTWCLDERKAELAALVDTMADADRGVVRTAISAAAGLQPVAPCRDPAVLAHAPPPALEQRAELLALYGELARMRLSLREEVRDETLAMIADVRTRAEAIGWLPTVARARDVEGALLETAGDYAGAETAFLAAYNVAGKASAWSIAADAATDLERNIGFRQSRHREGEIWAAHAEMAASLAGDPLGLREADRLAELGAIRLAAGDLDAAMTACMRALELREAALGDDHPSIAHNLIIPAHIHRARSEFAEAKALLERALAIAVASHGSESAEVATYLDNLGTVHTAAGEYDRGIALFERALPISIAAYGPEHPFVGNLVSNLAAANAGRGDRARARELLERALAIAQAAFGPDHPETAVALANLGSIVVATDPADAKPLFARALAIQVEVFGPDSIDVARTLANLGLAQHALGEIAAAEGSYERALAIDERELGPHDHRVAEALTGLASVRLASHRPAQAVELLQRAVAIYDAGTDTTTAELEARFDLAKALAASDGDHRRAREEAERARAGYVALGPGRADELAAIDAWLAARR